MLTNNDYRACLLAMFRSARPCGYTKREAYAYAKARVKPLPRTNLDAVLLYAWERVRYMRRSGCAGSLTPREQWAGAYRAARLTMFR